MQHGLEDRAKGLDIEPKRRVWKARLKRADGFCQDGDRKPHVVEAMEPTQFVVGWAAPHPHPLVLGYHSVHTSQVALGRGEAGIRALKARLEAEGRL